MAIKSVLKEGDVIQFPSHSLKKILQVTEEWVIFGAMRKPKKGTTYSCQTQKRSTYSKSFVHDYCFLVPNGVDLQSYLNQTHNRASKAADAFVDAYSDENTLKGYFIDDEEILDMPIVEDVD